MNKYFLINNDFDVEGFFIRHQGEDICLMNYDFDDAYYTKNFNIIHNYDNYDLIILKYDNDAERKIILGYISEKCEREYKIYENEKDIEFENKDNILYLLSVGQGSYDDYYERPTGLFHTRQKAMWYYKNDCELTEEEIIKNNEIFNEIDNNAPNEDDFEDENHYFEAYEKYWEQQYISYIAEDEKTNCVIQKLKIIL